MITKERFGVTKDGREVACYTLTNANGAYVKILDYGCTVQSIVVPDRDGKLVDVCLGYDTLAEYEENDGHLGGVVGRHANRIAFSRFTLNGKEYHVARNCGVHHLHGGNRSFDMFVWDAEVCGDTLRLTRLSPDGEENYPGNLRVRVEYVFTDDCALHIRYFAETDADTIINLTNHAYFNLNGQASGTALGHLLQIDAEQITVNNADSVPTGELADVAGTPFDFRTPKAVEKDFHADNVLLQYGCGYDLNYALDNGGALREVAVLTGEKSGIVMTVATDRPGMQLYTGNYLGNRTGKGGVTYHNNDAVCLETQNYPDAMTHPNFPTPILRAGATYQTETVYRFSVKERA